MLFWRCTNPKCKRIYTYEELCRARAGRSGFQSRDAYTSKYYNESRTPYTPPRRKSRKIPKIIGITLASILATAMLIITAPFSPSVSISPLNLRFTVDDGLNPLAQILEVRSSRGTVIWSATDDAQWLNLDPANGSTDEETSITLLADITGMHPGEYAATVTISAPDAKNTPVEVPVNLVITETSETLAIKETVGGSTGEVEIYYGTQPPYSKGLAYTKINLVNYMPATDPTWQELVEFIRSDTTDEDLYLEGIHMCASFAEKLHNNAEQTGIRAAWVAVDLAGSELHALNAFNTVDRGIMFVDCTGGGLRPVQIVINPVTDMVSHVSGPDYDKVAYVKVGQEYGLISLHVAESPGYEFYEEYRQRREDYEARVMEYNLRVNEYSQKVDEYNEEISGRHYYEGSAAYHRILEIYGALKQEEGELKQEEEELKQLQQEVGSFYWEPLGLVSHVEIYW